MFGACQANGYIGDDGRNAFFATIRSGLFLSRNDPLPALADRPKPLPDGKRTNPRQKAWAAAGAGHRHSATQAGLAPTLSQRPHMPHRKPLTMGEGRRRLSRASRMRRHLVNPALPIRLNGSNPAKLKLLFAPSRHSMQKRYFLNAFGIMWWMRLTACLARPIMSHPRS